MSANSTDAVVVPFKDGVLELRVGDDLRPSVLRVLTGTTPLDTEIDELPLPLAPWGVRAVVRVLRWYRRAIAPKLGQRCGMDPSCSHYAELAIRRHGLLRGYRLTVARLRRCRPGIGGLDIP